MPPQLALLGCGLFIFWLFVRDHRQNKSSFALWLPLLWMLVLGSRPVTLWLSLGSQLDASVDYSEGTPADRAFFLGLIIAGLFVLAKRRIRLASFVSSNKWLSLFYLFWGASILWSPDSFVSFKRWIKELGNVVMVLIILTDDNPLAAVRTVLARMTYLLIPLSVLFIKYYPDLGRAYNHWTWLPSITGVTTGKNALGELVLVCGLAFLWDVLDSGLRGDRFRFRQDRLAKTILALMMLWLITKANSATSLVCFILGIGLLFAFRNPNAKKYFRQIEIYALLLGILIGLFNLIVPINSFFVQGLGRNLTLTDRTYIWQLALAADQNPMLGTGFYSFWSTPASKKITSEYEDINQAHNGYLETYLNGGIVGLILLIVLLVVSFRRIKYEAIHGSTLAQLFFVFYLTALIHNITEASFNRVDIIWFILLLSIVNVAQFVPDELPSAGKDDKAAVTVESDGVEIDTPPGRISGIPDFKHSGQRSCI